MKIVTAIQARTSSSRLPNKVLLPILGEPFLCRMIERVSRASLCGTVVVATSVDQEDDAIEQLCEKEGILCFRGDLTDLLDRHYQLAIAYGADALVKIPSDCPLIDPVIVDQVIGYYLDTYPLFDYVSNLHPASYPDGNDVEIMSFAALRTACRKALKDFEREHTTPFLWENPQKFNIGNVTWPAGKDFSATHRFTIDYDDDYRFISEVYNRLYPENPGFNLDEILSLIEAHPDIAELNKKYAGHYWYDNHLDELNTIDDYKHKLSEYDD